MVPLHNERENVEPFFEELRHFCEQHSAQIAELIVVDDGSQDGTWQELCKVSQHWPCSFVILRLRRNFGKGAALQAAFDKATGEWICTLDGDGQDVPNQIPRLFDQAQQRGVDFVVGWRRCRQDSFAKVWASRIYNRIVRQLFGLPLHDINCGLRLLRRSCLQELQFYGHQYRLLPLIFWNHGFSVAEVEVAHRPRCRGKSKYGVGRYFTGLLDLFTFFFVSRFPFRPAHFFGTVGGGLLCLGIAICFYIAYLRVAYGTIGFRYPLLILGVLLTTVGLQLILTGFLAELFTHFLHPQKSSYSLAEVQIYENHKNSNADSSLS